MPSGFLATLTKTQQKELLHDLNYLNTAEIKTFCKRHSIPFKIAVETKSGIRKTTPDHDRKGVVLERIRHFLRTGKILPQTCFAATIVCFDPFPQNPSGDDRLFYGRYDKGNPQLLVLLKSLTGGEFQDGAIARMLARDFWTDGKAPTLKEFASAWMRASRDHTRPNPEWAFLSDRAAGLKVTDWKKLRAEKAANVLIQLIQIDYR